MKDKISSAQASRPPACPLCGAPRDSRFRPFCSKRCADIDLNRWLSGAYRIAGSEKANPDEENGAER